VDIVRHRCLSLRPGSCVALSSWPRSPGARGVGGLDGRAGTPDADIDDWGLVVAGSEEEGVEVGLAGDELPLEAPVGEGSVGAGLVDEGLVGLGGEGFVRVTGDGGAGSARGSELEQPTVPSSVAEANAAIICRMTGPAILGVSFRAT
jgi:hypothetical protein